MARTAITPQAPLGSYDPYAAGDADLAMNASTGAAGSSGNQFVSSGNDLVIVQNTDVGAQTITFTSVDDPYGRSEDITTYELDPDQIGMFGPFQVTGWRQTDNNVYFETSDAGMLIAVIPL